MTGYLPKGLLSVAVAVAGVTLGLHAARAQEPPVQNRVAHARHVRTAQARPLTVHARRHRPVRSFYADEGFDEPAYVVGPLHRWDDPRLYNFGPWRLGGDNFYGDSRGEPITRGNTTLGMIAGYGGARGGYGGPYFDSVGGFHNGPGPEAKEAADYASGSIWRPDYGDIAPHYPSIKAQVAALNTGIVPGGRSDRPASSASAWRTNAAYRPAAAPQADLPSEPDDD